ncbi:MAG: adenylate/guanylate cyclase domain-containing protein, partial [Rhodospirillaceae bacterium]|nr:adenylate/guanylate cyclase domain-containing protein [Rhodospirillaceae bacterium]
MVKPALLRTPGLPVRLAVAGLAALLVALMYLGGRDVGLFRAIETEALTLRFEMRGPLEPGDGIVLIAIDDATLLEAGGWPVPPDMLAALVDKLVADGAAIVVLDLLLTDLAGPSDGLTPGAGDRALVEAARRFEGKLVLPIAFVLGEESPVGNVPVDTLAPHAFRLIESRKGADSAAPVPRGALVPFATLRDAVRLGHVNLGLDNDGQLRAMYHAIGVGDLYFPSLPIVLLALREGVPVETMTLQLGKGIRVGDRRVATAADMALSFNFLGPAGSFDHHSLASVLGDELPPDTFRDRIVFVGATALGIGDGYSTPFGIVPGVEVLATATDNLFEDRPLIRDERTTLIDLAAILALALLMAALPRLRGAATAIVAGAVFVLIWQAIAYVAFLRAHWWLDSTFPTLAAILAGGAVLTLWFTDERRLRAVAEQDRAAMVPYVSPVAAAGLDAADSATEAPRPAVVMFVDMAGFTALAEQLDPLGTRDLLQRFRTHVSESAMRHGGVVEKFIGDGAMLLFGFPEPDLQDPINALECARDLVQSLPSAAGDVTPADGWHLHIGLHYGLVTLARIGDQNRAEITATGDTVNVASRLEAATRDHDAAVAASGSVAEAVRAGGRADLLTGFRRR